MVTDDTAIDQTTIAGFPAVHAAPRTATGLPPVVFLHGAFADEAGFEGWVGRFAAAGFDAWAPARRGRRGIGPDRAAGLTFDDYVEDTLAVLDALGSTTPPVLVGHSLGGLVAQRIAERGQAGAIALLAPAPPSMLTAQAIAPPAVRPEAAPDHDRSTVHRGQRRLFGAGPQPGARGRAPGDPRSPDPRVRRGLPVADAGPRAGGHVEGAGARLRGVRSGGPHRVAPAGEGGPPATTASRPAPTPVAVTG